MDTQKIVVGKLSITDSIVTFTSSDTNIIKCKNSPLRRIPANVIWGFIDYSKQSEYNKVKQYFKALHNVGARQVQLREGNYGFFKTNAAGQIIQNSLSSKNSMVFLLSYSSSEKTLRKITNYHSKLSNEKLHIYLFSSEAIWTREEIRGFNYKPQQKK